MRGLNPIGFLLLAVLIVVSVGFGVLFFELRSENQQLHELIVSRELEIPPTENNPDREVDVAEAVAVDKQYTSTLLSRVATLIISDEGVRRRPYSDTNGTPTIGVGRNLSGNGVSVEELKAIAGELDYDLLLSETHIENGRVRIRTLDLANRVFVKPLTESDIHLLLLDDLAVSQNDALTVFGAELWGKIAENRQIALLDTIFALGLPRFKQFKNLIGAVKVGDWNTAATELLKSEAADEAPARYFRNYYILKNNKILER